MSSHLGLVIPITLMFAGELYHNAIKILSNHSTSTCFDGRSQISITEDEKIKPVLRTQSIMIM